MRSDHSRSPLGATFDERSREMEGHELRFAEHGCEFYCLCELRQFPVQQQAVANRFASFIREPAVGVAGTAFVVTSALRLLQAKRVVAHPLRRFFEDRKAAEEWLAVLRAREPTERDATLSSL